MCAKGTGPYDFGYSRDKLPDLRQVNFGVAELRDPINISIDLSVNRGSASDSVQFVRIVDDIVGDFRDYSLFVFDAGGDAKQVLDRITRDMKYITGKRMNKSDDLRINQFRKDGAFCVDADEGVYCQRRTFEQSGHTVTCSSPRSCIAIRWQLWTDVHGDVWRMRRMSYAGSGTGRPASRRL